MEKKYSSLDGLRSFAAIGIVIMHILANLDMQADSNSFLYKTIIPSLSFAVYLFFEISAFSMCCGYYERMKMGQISMNSFYQKRYMRILPFFALLILIDFVIPHGINKAESSSIVEDSLNPLLCQLYESFANLTLCFNLLPNPDIKVIGVGWFLGVVFLFYMLFPFFVFLLDNKKRMWLSMILSFIFCYIAIVYFYTDKFVNFSTVRHNFIYCAPFFLMGGCIYLYKDKLCEFTKKNRWLMLSICWMTVVLFWIIMPSSFLFVLTMSLLCGSLLIYAIGTEGKVLNNRFTKYLSGISMEVYLCHMMAFRGVEMLHLSRYISQPDLLYWLTCILTLGGAIAFSHIVKYKLLPLVEPFYCKQYSK